MDGKINIVPRGSPGKVIAHEEIVVEEVDPPIDRTTVASNSYVTHATSSDDGKKINVVPFPPQFLKLFVFVLVGLLVFEHYQNIFPKEANLVSSQVTSGPSVCFHTTSITSKTSRIGAKVKYMPSPSTIWPHDDVSVSNDNKGVGTFLSHSRVLFIGVRNAKNKYLYRIDRSIYIDIYME